MKGASFYVNDHLGNTRIVFNRNTCDDPDFPFYVESTQDYYPFGKVLREYHAGQKEKYLTTQHERDGETGFDYRGARQYDSDLGLFLSIDPHHMDYPHLSPYVYVMNNPTAFIDPDGKDSRVWIKKNENGGGTIIISTVTHVYGKNADRVAKEANEVYSSLNTIENVEIDGEVWTVAFDVIFEVNHELDELDPEKEGLNYRDVKDKGIDGITKGDNFMCSDCPLPMGTVEVASMGDSRSISGGGSAAPHAVFHNFGFKDRYSLIGDVMSRSKPTRIDRMHFVNAAKTILTEMKELEMFPTEYPSDQDGALRDTRSQEIFEE